MDGGVAFDWHVVQSLAISLALGAIIGLERQSHELVEPIEEEGLETIGVRTFSLASLLGTLAAYSESISPALPWIAGIGFLLLITAFYVAETRARGRMSGITTEVASLLAFLLGAMVPSQPLFAAGVAVIVAVILSIKRYTHRFVARLSQREVFDTLKFLIVTVVVLPLLPNEAVDPWGIYNPRQVWLLIILISGISFLGYFAMRFLGPRRGVSITGAVGGLASSTAVTLAMAQRARESGQVRGIISAAAFAVLIANTIMIVRVTIEVAAINPSLVSQLWLSTGAITLAALGGAAIFGWRLRGASRDIEAPLEAPVKETETEEDNAEADGAEEDVLIKNPFRLGPALKFGLIFLAILGTVHLARTFFGDSGTYAAALISGLADVDAVSLAVARLASTGEMSPSIAIRAIILAIISNSLVKAALCGILGSRELGGRVLVGLIAPLLVAAGALVFV